MKCNYHPEIDAIGTCVYCGRMLCSECALQLAGRTYCQPCADRIFATEPTPAPKPDRSGLLTAGGILSIASGGLGLLSLLFIIPFFIIPFIPGAEDDLEGDAGFYMFYLMFLVPYFLVFGVLSALAIIGGIYALKRERWGLALGGAICGAIPSSIPGIIAIVFIAMSKDEFKKPSLVHSKI